MLSRVERVALAVIAAGLAARFWLAASNDLLDWDVAWYMVMARSLVEDGAFVVPWTGAPTHHYPPLYPALLAALFAVGGASIELTRAATATIGALHVGVVYLGTRDLYGRSTGLVVAALVAACPPLIQYDALGHPESLLGIFFVATLWAILKSLDRPAYILVAGLGAGLAYLTKASVGPFFLLAAAGGLAWRIHHRGRAALRDPWYLAAGAIFASFVLAWTARNVAHFGPGGWETQPYATGSLRLAFSRADVWGVLLAKLLASALLLVALVLPLAGRLRMRAREVLADERRSALLLAILLPAAIATIFAVGFVASEGRALFDVDDARYLVIALVPLAWLALGESQPEQEVARRSPRARIVLPLGFALAAVLLLDGRALGLGRPHAFLWLLFTFAAAGAFARLFHGAHTRAVAFGALLVLTPLAGATDLKPWDAAFDDLRPRMVDGDSLAIEPAGMHFAAALAPAGVDLVAWEDGPPPNTTFALVTRGRNGPFEGYHQLKAYATTSAPLPLWALQERFSGRASDEAPKLALAAWGRD